MTDHPPTPLAHQKLVLEWEKKPTVKGRPSCPCGFVGGSRNIVNHRVNCAVWTAYARRRTWHTE